MASLHCLWVSCFKFNWTDLREYPYRGLFPCYISLPSWGGTSWSPRRWWQMDLRSFSTRRKARLHCLFFWCVFLVLSTINFNTFLFFLGINRESSFEAEVLSNTKHCQVWGYDFSVSSFGPEISNFVKYRTHFHAYGLSGQDKHGPFDNPPMYTLESLMKMNGNFCPNHFRIDEPHLWPIYHLQGILILTFSRSISKVGNSRPWRISLSHMSIPENPFHSVNSRWRSTFGIRASSPSLVGGKCLKLLVFVPSRQNLTWFTLIIIRRKVHQTLQRFVRFFSYKEMSGSWYWI